MDKLCRECGAEQMTVERRDQLRKRFEEAHSKGAEKFSGRWLTANQSAIAAAESLDIDPSDVLIRALLSEVCYDVLGADDERVRDEIASEQWNRLKERNKMQSVVGNRVRRAQPSKPPLGQRVFTCAGCGRVIASDGTVKTKAFVWTHVKTKKRSKYCYTCDGELIQGVM